MGGPVKSIMSIQDIKRKGSWGVRHYKRNKSYNKLNNRPLSLGGRPTPFAKQSGGWGYKVPKTRNQQANIVRRSDGLLRIYRNFKDGKITKSSALSKAKIIERNSR